MFSREAKGRQLILFVAIFLAVAAIAATAQSAYAQAGSQFVGSYARSFTGASGQVVVDLQIRPDGTAVMTSTYENSPRPVVQTGTWSVRNGRLVVDLTDRNGRRDRLVFARQGSSLVATRYNRGLYGAGPLVFSSSRPSGRCMDTITGVVTYRERIALSPSAVVTVKLVDASRVTIQQEVLATATIRNLGQVPVAFTLSYDPSLIDLGHNYVLEATITEGGRRIFETGTRVPVITHRAPIHDVEVVLERVRGY